jgi:hypothetical protein
MKNLRPFAKLAAALAAFSPLLAFAGVPVNNVPEPGTWALVALAGAIGVAVVRNKRK